MKFYEFNEDEKRVDIFNERFYKIGDKFYRNVTTILGIIDKGYNYTEWLKQTGYNSEIIVDRAGKFGSMFHSMVEKYLKGEDIKYYDYVYLGESTATALWERFNVWIGFWKEFNEKYKVEVKPDLVEIICYSDINSYAGTCDLFCKVDGVLTVIDWKTGNSLDGAGARDDAEMQMCAYMRALEEQYNKVVPQAKLIWLPHKYINQKGYRILDVDNSGELFDAFLAAKKLFERRNTDKPKVLSLPLEVNLESLTKE